MTEINRATIDYDATGLIALNAGDGIMLAHGPVMKGRSRWTGGAYNLIDAVVAPRSITAVHKHATDDQVGIVLHGRIGFWVEGSAEVELGAGGYAFRPAGKFHALWNPGDTPAHVVELTSPGRRFEEYILELSRLTAAGEADRTAIEEAARHAGITFSNTHLVELCDKHGVNPDGAFWKP